MPLGTEADLGQGDIVLDGDPAPPRKQGAQQPLLFGPCLLWPNGWMEQDVLNMEVGLGPGHIVLNENPATQRGTAPNFRSTSVVAKGLD